MKNSGILIQSQIVPLMGMHRSGSSCLAQILHASGMFMGMGLDRRAEPGNLFGYWESSEAVRISDEILRQSQGAWNKVPPELRADEIVEAKIADFLRQMQQSPLASWKDPRLSLTYPVWRRFFRPKAVVVFFRHPMGVARSLSRRNGWPIEQGLDLWEKYNRALLRHLQDEPQVYWWDYDDPRWRSHELLSLLMRGLGLDPPADLERVFNPHLYHVPKDGDELPPDLESLYLRLHEYSRDTIGVLRSNRLPVSQDTAQAAGVDTDSSALLRVFEKQSELLERLAAHLDAVDRVQQGHTRSLISYEKTRHRLQTELKNTTEGLAWLAQKVQLHVSQDGYDRSKRIKSRIQSRLNRKTVPAESGASLWVDRSDFKLSCQTKRQAHQINESDCERLLQWHERGYVVLRGFVDPDLIDGALRDYERVWVERPACRILIQGMGVCELKDAPSRQRIKHHHYRLMDFHNLSESTSRLMMTPEIIRFMGLIFEEVPVAMQTLFLEYGSEQGCHQDFAYVHTSPLAHVAASAILLEDVDLNGGPLFYYSGSHRIPEFDFGGGQRKHVSDSQAGSPGVVKHYEHYLSETCRRKGLSREYFTGSKGDVILWHAKLVHGGSRVMDPGRTRKTLVSHYARSSSYPFDQRNPAKPPQAEALSGGVYYRWRRAGHVEWRYRL